jgi:hypothetical protein
VGMGCELQHVHQKLAFREVQVRSNRSVKGNGGCRYATLNADLNLYQHRAQAQYI